MSYWSQCNDIFIIVLVCVCVCVCICVISNSVENIGSNATHLHQMQLHIYHRVFFKGNFAEPQSFFLWRIKSASAALVFHYHSHMPLISYYVTDSWEYAPNLPMARCMAVHTYDDNKPDQRD